ncbi:MAG: hypothetical protein HY020_02005 [Burkholderiales bacterium]|nr:hypothetical protein [Burkholderiales bacterium]
MPQLLKLTVMAYEGPMLRSYLGMLAAAGYMVDRLLLLVQKRDPATRKLVLPWLPSGLRRAAAARVQDQRLNHWPRQLARRYGTVCRAWQDGLAERFGFDASAYRWLQEDCAYEAIAQSVDTLFVDGFKDPAMLDALRALPARTPVLFTGGGLLPATVFEASNCRFLHIHPGLLPNVKGADGMLWSVLLRARAAASAFYMEPGLDTGAIVRTTEFAALPVPADFASLDIATQYRLFYSFVDPMMRAVLLRDLLEEVAGADLFDLPAQSQDPSLGTTFNFMNERLRRLAFQRMHELAARNGGRG